MRVFTFILLNLFDWFFTKISHFISWKLKCQKMYSFREEKKYATGTKYEDTLTHTLKGGWAYHFISFMNLLVWVDVDFRWKYIHVKRDEIEHALLFICLNFLWFFTASLIKSRWIKLRLFYNFLNVVMNSLAKLNNKWIQCRGFEQNLNFRTILRTDISVLKHKTKTRQNLQENFTYKNLKNFS